MYKTIPGMLLVLLTACGGPSADEKARKNYHEGDAPVAPAKPAGTLEVKIEDREKDTSKVTFYWTVDSLKYDKTFNDLPLMQNLTDTSLYKVLWDAPNSVWIGFIKPNRDTRYYHGSQDGKSLRILWVPSPPQRIYQYMEKDLGLGDAIRNYEKVTRYAKQVKSGQIIAEFIVDLRNATPEKVGVYMEYGGVRREIDMPTPKGTKPYIMAVAEDHCVVGLELEDGEMEDIYQVRIVNGRIGYKQMQTVK
ncbi:hypothetical protein [Chitinophaga rhizosphaerae]|uniref:hypothetical protein n=1 Tax=Chitinophaga rhizosphaerae TaxID=1864947 RepID=UPI000F805D77|nr:hypothetical protein [Chitinophaga rhizosphaerae]